MNVDLSYWERARVVSYLQPYRLSTRRVYVASYVTLTGYGDWRYSGITGRACASVDRAVASLNRVIARKTAGR